MRDRIEYFGAATMLNAIIESLKMDDVKFKPPGHEYLLERLEQLQNEIEAEIFTGFMDALKDLADAVNENKENEDD